MDGVRAVEGVARVGARPRTRSAHADHYGIGRPSPTIDLPTVWRGSRRSRRQIAATDDDPRPRTARWASSSSPGHATVTGPNQVTVDGDRVLDTRFILLCTGSRPIEPSIPGLHDAGYLTSENLFEIESPPAAWSMIGGGPIAIEMAQAFVRLGIATTRAPERARASSPATSRRSSRCSQARLRAEGVDLRLNVDADERPRRRRRGR